MSSTATAAQIRYATHLLGGHSLPEGSTPVEEMTKAQASYLISMLRRYPLSPKAVPAKAEIPPVGMYRTNTGEIIRLYMGQNSGQVLAKRVLMNETASYEYIGSARGLINGRTKLGTVTLSPMTLEEAKAWGRLTGHCCVCARLLTDPESVDAGIGPVCAGKF